MKWKILILALLLPINAIAQVPNFPFWGDSYSSDDGICRCQSNYDHGINNTMWDTPCGTKSVPQICAEILEVYGVGNVSSATAYNTVQCGWPPVNNVADETDCPGIPANTSGTYTGPRCNETGPQWPLQGVCDALNPQPVTLSCTESSWIGNAAAFLGLKKRCPNFEPTLPRWAFLGFSMAFLLVVLNLGLGSGRLKPLG